METLSITLANGHKTAPEKLRTYFETVFADEDQGEEFAVKMADIWPIGYATKGGAVKALQKNFVENVDFRVVIQPAENPQGGRPEEVYHLTTSCAEYFAVRVNRDVFEVYRACRQAVKSLLRAALPDFSNPVAAARAWADAEEGRLLAEGQARAAAAQLQVAAPKIAFADAVAVSTNAVSFSKAAQMLKIPRLAGRTRLVRQLKADGILQANRQPYQSYVDAGYFEVQLRTYQPGKKEEKGAKGTRVTSTTRVTATGLAWLLKRYRPTPTLPVTA